MRSDPRSPLRRSVVCSLAIAAVALCGATARAAQEGERPGPTPQPRPTSGDVALDSFVESLVPRMSDASPRVRSAVRAALLDAGTDAIPVLKAVMAETADESVKRGIGEIIRRLETGGGAGAREAKAAGKGAGKGGKGGGAKGGKGGGKAAAGGAAASGKGGGPADSKGMPRSPLLTADRVMQVVEATADQKPKITQAFDEFEAARRAAAEEMRRIGDPSIMTERLVGIREDLDQRLKVILNPEQFLKFKSQFAPPGERRGSGGGEASDEGGD